MYYDEAVDPDKYHKQLDAESDFYKDQKKQYDAAKKAGKKIEYRIDPERDKPKTESMNFTEFLQSEDYKLFPTGKVEDKVKKLKKQAKEDPHGVAGRTAGHRAHRMNAVKNFRSKTTDAGDHKGDHGGGSAFTGKAGEKTYEQEKSHNTKAWQSVEKREKQGRKADKAGAKGDTEKQAKHGEKHDKHNEDMLRHSKRASAMRSVRTSFGRTKVADDEKQTEHNRNVRDLKRSMKKSDDREKLEKTAKKKGPLEGKRDTKTTKGEYKTKGPKIKNTIKKTRKEAMDFTDFLNDLKDPLYEVKGEMPKCPPGYKWNPKTMQCVPKTEKDNVNGPGNSKMPYGGNFYNVIGSSGWDGGWAFEELPTPGTEGDAL